MTAYDDVKIERDRQDRKWGTVKQNPHTSREWMLILDEEVEEAWQEEKREDGPDWRREMVHVAAVAIAAIEQYDMEDAEMRQKGSAS